MLLAKRTKLDVNSFFFFFLKVLKKREKERYSKPFLWRRTGIRFSPREHVATIKLSLLTPATSVPLEWGLSAEGPLLPQFSCAGNGLQLALHTAPFEKAVRSRAVSLLSFQQASACSSFPALSPPLLLTLLLHVSFSPLPLCLLFSEVSLRSKVVTLNSCFSNHPHVTGYLLIGGFP